MQAHWAQNLEWAAPPDQAQITVHLEALVDDAILGEEFSQGSRDLLESLFAQLAARKQ